MWSSNFIFKKLCTWDEPIIKFSPKQKNQLCTILNYLPPQPTYLLVGLGLGQPMYLPIYMNKYLA